MSVVDKKKKSVSDPQLRLRVVTLISGAAAIAYALFGFVPAQKQQRTMRKTIAEKAQFVAEANLKAASDAALERELAEVRAFVKEHREQGIHRETVSAWCDRVIREARTVGVEIAGFTPQKETTLATMNFMPVSVSIDGNFHAIHAWMAAVERLHGSIHIDQFEMRSAGVAGKLRCEAKLTIFIDRNEISG